MQFTLATLTSRKTADLVIVPFWKEKGQIHLAAAASSLQTAMDSPLALGDFLGKEGESLLLYVTGQPEKRILLLGLGEKEKVNTELLRRAYGSLAKLCQAKKFKSLNILVPHIPGVNAENCMRGLTEGLLLANYAFNKHKNDTVRDNPVILIQKVTLIGAEKGGLEAAEKWATISRGVNFARDLVNSNADEITPAYLGEVAQQIAKEHAHVKATVFDKKRIEKEKMGLLLAVNRGSHLEPRFIILEYRGNGKSKDHTVLVGKGITYDTGGLNLKGSGMDTMRCDMGGAAVALATVKVAAELKLPVNLTAVIPATENSLSSLSYKPGDVYQGYSGKTVEIGNTDAEGRLVLADALAYAEEHLKPTRMIDFATLTGGVDIALGNEITGMMSTHDVLADQLATAGSATFERVWRLPLLEEYKENLKSEVADMKNVAGSRSASPIIGGTFLRAFVKDTPWAHLDIASTAFIPEGKRYHPKLATGVGVRLMIEFLDPL